MNNIKNNNVINNFMIYANKHYDCPTYYEFSEIIKPIVSKYCKKHNLILLDNYFNKFSPNGKQLIILSDNATADVYSLTDLLTDQNLITTGYNFYEPNSYKVSVYFKNTCILYQIPTNNLVHSYKYLWNIALIYKKYINPILFAKEWPDLIEFEQNIWNNIQLDNLPITTKLKHYININTIIPYFNNAIFTGMIAYSYITDSNCYDTIDILVEDITPYKNIVNKKHDTLLNIFGNYWIIKQKGIPVIRIFELNNSINYNIINGIRITNIHGTLLWFILMNKIGEHKYDPYMFKLFKYLPKCTLEESNFQIFQDNIYGKFTENIKYSKDELLNYIPDKFNNIIN